MPNSLVIALEHQRRRERIDLDAFANELQTTIPRHMVQDFVGDCEENNYLPVRSRFEWMEIYVYWKALRDVEGNPNE